MTMYYYSIVLLLLLYPLFIFSTQDERTNAGRGGTPIYWARNDNGDDHPVVQYLDSIGAVDISPE